MVFLSLGLAQATVLNGNDKPHVFRREAIGSKIRCRKCRNCFRPRSLRVASGSPQSNQKQQKEERMFTVKICNQGHNTYFETDAFTTEVLEAGTVALRFSAQNDEKCIMFAGVSGNMERLPEGASTAERAYIMNDQGKTIEVIR